MTDPMHWPYTTDPEELSALAAAEQSEPVALPEIVRDVQSGWTCSECGKGLAGQKTVTMHEGKPYCSFCFNPGAGS